MRSLKLSKLIQSKFNVVLYVLLGWNLAKYYMQILVNLYYMCNSDKKIAIENAISDVVERLNLEIDTDDTIRNVFYGVFAHYYEKMFIGFSGYKKKNKFIEKNIKCNELNVLDKSLLKGNGVIVITGHYGAIEYIPALLGLNKYKVSMIAKFKTEKLKKKILSQAAYYNARFIDTENNNILMDSIKELKQNRILITQCDEFDEWRPSKRDSISFLGHRTGMDRTINILKKRSGAEIVFSVIHRHNLCKYELKMYTYEDMLKMFPSNSKSSAGEVVLKTLEKHICLYPEQWYLWEKYFMLTNINSFHAVDSNRLRFPLFANISEEVA